MDGRFLSTDLDNLGQLIGRTLTGVMLRETTRRMPPFAQVFLFFDHELMFEIYTASEFPGASGKVYYETMDEVRETGLDRMRVVYEAREPREMLDRSLPDVALPSWLESAEDDGQRSFPIVTSRTVAKELGVRVEDFESWRRLGWIAFDAGEHAQLTASQAGELELVWRLIRSGLSNRCIRELLSRIPEPASFEAGRMVFSPRHGWVRVAPRDAHDPMDVVGDHVDDWIERLADEGEYEELARVRDRIDELLASGLQDDGGDGAGATEDAERAGEDPRNAAHGPDRDKGKVEP
jgi:hypothetical protein